VTGNRQLRASIRKLTHIRTYILLLLLAATTTTTTTTTTTGQINYCERQRCPCALTEHHAMKAYWRSGGIASRILDLGNRWR
jgi:hypothetical protein